MAASATFALKAGVWFRRGRLLMVSPDSRATACPLSGRNSTYRPVQISGAGSTFGAVILHFVNLPIPRAQAKGDDEHAEALRQKAAAQTGRRICWSWRRDIAPPLIPKGWSFVRNPPTSPMISAMCGLRDVLVSSGACEAAPKDINWRLTVGFEFRVWRDLWWHLRRCIVINLRLCLPSWQPVTLSRAIGDLTSNCRSRSNTRVKT